MTTITQALPREALCVFNTLLGHLQEEAKLFERLVSLLDAERDALRSLRAPGLSDINREKDRVLELIQRVASARVGSVEELNEWLGMDRTTPSIARLLDHLPPVEHQCLKDARDRLQSVAQMVKRRGEVAERLLSVSLDAIHGVLQLVRQETAGSVQVYGGGGEVAVRGTGMVLRHIA